MKNINNLFGIIALMVTTQFFTGCMISKINDNQKQELNLLIAQSDGAAIEYIEKNSIDVNAVYADSGGGSILHVAAIYANKTVAQYLIEHGANVNARSKGGDTPIYIAAMINDVQGVRLLLEAGADPTIADVNGLTPLAIARASGSHNVVKFLTTVD